MIAGGCAIYLGGMLLWVLFKYHRTDPAMYEHPAVSALVAVIAVATIAAGLMVGHRKRIP